MEDARYIGLPDTLPFSGRAETLMGSLPTDMALRPGHQLCLPFGATCIRIVRAWKGCIHPYLATSGQHLNHLAYVKLYSV